MKKILMFARGIGEYTETLTNAKELLSDYEIMIVRDFHMNDQVRQNFEGAALKHGIQVQSVNHKDNFTLSYEKKHYKKNKFINRVIAHFDRQNKRALQGDKSILLWPYKIISANYLLFKRSFLTQIKVLKTKQRRFAVILDHYKPDIFMLNNANGATNSEIYLNETKKRNIPSILVPFTFVLPESPAKTLSANPNYALTGFRKIFAQLFLNKWLYRYEGTTVVRIPFGRIFALKLLKAEPNSPWVQDHCSCDYIISESAFLTQHYINGGINPDKIHTLGKLNHDVLYKPHRKRKKIQQELRKELKLKGDRPYILVSVPPPIDVYSKEQFKVEFKNHYAVFKFLVDATAKSKTHDVILSLHPSIRNNAKMMKKYTAYKSDNCHISLRPTTELVAGCDMFVACNTGTIIWSLSLGIITIDYDILARDIDYFITNSDVLYVRTKKEYRAFIKTLNNDDTFLPAQRKKFKAIKKQYGAVDGKAGQRLKDFIEEITQ